MKRRTPIKRSGALKRKTELKTMARLENRTPIKAKPKPARSKEEVTASAVWKEAVIARGCEVCRARGEICEGALQAHHVVTQQALRSRGLAHLLWDVTNGLCVCYRAHRRHHNRAQPVERKLLRHENITFAERNGLVDLIERYYPS